MPAMARLPMLLLAIGGLAAADGSVQFSDGRLETGELRWAQDLVLHDGRVQHRLERGRIRDVRLEPEREEMAAAWRFPEPGKPAKELVGRPYPVRILRASVRLDDGSLLSGHLHTTVAYLDGPDGAAKVILPAKQQGGPDQGLADLVYPVRLAVVAADAAPVAGTGRLRLPAAEATEVAVLAGSGLVRLPAVLSADGDWILPPGLIPPGLVAARTPTGLVAAWPGDDAALRARLAVPVAALADYLDDRRLLAAAADGDACLALLLLCRSGTTTGDPAARPWRLEVWRWRGDPLDPQRWLLAARGLLLRGTGTLPPVRVEPAWWPLRAGAAGWEVGDGG